MYPLELSSHDVDLVVVGGGLAGLSAAALVAQTGRSVTVYEQASDVGGRAATQVRQSISFNLGPHALYCRGQAFRLMRDLGVPFAGNVPNPGKSRLFITQPTSPCPAVSFSGRPGGCSAFAKKGD